MNKFLEDFLKIPPSISVNEISNPELLRELSRRKYEVLKQYDIQNLTKAEIENLKKEIFYE